MHAMSRRDDDMQDIISILDWRVALGYDDIDSYGSRTYDN